MVRDGEEGEEEGEEGEGGENSPYVWKHGSSTPSGPLPCYPFNFKYNLLRQGTGTADHLTLLWLLFSYGEVSNLIRLIGASNEIVRVTKFENSLLFGAKQNYLRQIFFEL